MDITHYFHITRVKVEERLQIFWPFTAKKVPLLKIPTTCILLCYSFTFTRDSPLYSQASFSLRIYFFNQVSFLHPFSSFSCSATPRYTGQIIIWSRISSSSDLFSYSSQHIRYRHPTWPALRTWSLISSSSCF